MEKGQGFQELGPRPLWGLFTISLGTVVAPVGVPFSVLTYYSEPIMRLKVYWELNLLHLGSNQSVLSSAAVPFLRRLCPALFPLVSVTGSVVFQNKEKNCILQCRDMSHTF